MVQMLRCGQQSFANSSRFHFIHFDINFVWTILMDTNKLEHAYNMDGFTIIRYIRSAKIRTQRRRRSRTNKWCNESKIRVHSVGIILSRFIFSASSFSLSLILTLFHFYTICSYFVAANNNVEMRKQWNQLFPRLFVPVSFNLLGILFCFISQWNEWVLLANFIDDQIEAFGLIQKDQNQLKHLEALGEGGNIERFPILNWPVFHSLVATSFCIELENSISRWCSSLLLSIDCVRSRCFALQICLFSFFIRYYLPINQWINRREHYLLSFNH